MARSKKKTAETVEEAAAVKPVEKGIKFPKKSFLRFEKYARVRDLLKAMLEDGESYSIGEVDEMLNKLERSDK